MAVSIKDIARLAGVSHSTVSRALRGSPLIPPGTTRRIQDIASELGYSVSAVGRGLVQGRTESIGIVVTSIDDPFNGEVVAGIEEVANDAGYSVILATSQANPEREISVVRAFQSRRVDGIVVASSRVGSNYTSVLAELKVPVVLLNNQHPDEFIYSVCIDDKCGAFDAANHVLQLGHRHIAYLGNRFGVRSDTERQAGVLLAAERAGVSVPAHVLIEGDGKIEGAINAVNILIEGARSRSHNLPSAIVCYNDVTAIGVIIAARRAGISIPDQLSVVGFDDIQMAELLTPALTTICQPKRELGARSMRVLLQLLRGEDAEKLVVLPGKLIVRDSTASPGRG